MSGKGGSGNGNGDGNGGDGGGRGGRSSSIVKAKERARRERKEVTEQHRPGAESVVSERNEDGKGRLANAKIRASRPAANASADEVKSGIASPSPSPTSQSAPAHTVPGAQAQYGQGRLADIKSADADARRGGGRLRGPSFAAKSAKEKGASSSPAEKSSGGAPHQQITSASTSKEQADLLVGETTMMSTESRFESKPADAVHVHESSLKTPASGPQIIRGEVGYDSEEGEAITDGREQFRYSVTPDEDNAAGAEVNDSSVTPMQRDGRPSREEDVETAGGRSSSIPEFVDNAAVAHIVSPEEIEREEAEFLDIPDAYEYQQPEAVPFRKTRRGRAFIAAGVCVVIAAVVGAAVGATVGGNSGGVEAAGMVPTPEPTMPPTPIAWTLSVQEYLTELIGPHVNNPGTPYNDALVWIEDVDPMNLTTREHNLLQRYLLATMYFSTVQEGGDGWLHCGASDPSSSGDGTCEAVIEDDGTKDNVGERVDPFPSMRWLSHASECEWMGIICDGTGDLVPGPMLDIVLVENNLQGTLIPELYQLSTIQGMLLLRNSLNGTIPSEYGQMPSIIQINIASNQLSGNLPPDIYDMALLQNFIVANNSLSGSIPAPPTGSWPKMEYLDLAMNGFSGEIPGELGNLESLGSLLLDQNNLVGPMPKEVCDLRSDGILRTLEVDCAEVSCSSECCTNCQA